MTRRVLPSDSKVRGALRFFVTVCRSQRKVCRSRRDKKRARHKTRRFGVLRSPPSSTLPQQQNDRLAAAHERRVRTAARPQRRSGVRRTSATRRRQVSFEPDFCATRRVRRFRALMRRRQRAVSIVRRRAYGRACTLDARQYEAATAAAAAAAAATRSARAGKLPLLTRGARRTARSVAAKARIGRPAGRRRGEASGALAGSFACLLSALNVVTRTRAPLVSARRLNETNRAAAADDDDDDDVDDDDDDDDRKLEHNDDLRRLSSYRREQEIDNFARAACCHPLDAAHRRAFPAIVRRSSNAPLCMSRATCARAARRHRRRCRAAFICIFAQLVGAHNRRTSKLAKRKAISELTILKPNEQFAPPQNAACECNKASTRSKRAT